MKHQHGRESAGMIFIARFMNSFLHQASFATGYWCYDRHRSVRLVVLVGLANDQIAQSGLSSLSVIYYSAQLFSVGLRVPLHPLYVVSAYLRKPLHGYQRHNGAGTSAVRKLVLPNPQKIASYNVRFWHTAAVKM
jgi:hypothetical protein